MKHTEEDGSIPLLQRVTVHDIGKSRTPMRVRDFPALSGREAGPDGSPGPAGAVVDGWALSGAEEFPFRVGQGVRRGASRRRAEPPTRPGGGIAGRLGRMSARLTGTGIWSGMLRYGDMAQVAPAAAELESLGYSALWIPDVGGDLFTPLGTLLGATTTATIATGILNVWMHTPEEAAAQHARLTAEHGPRYLCGIGISHRPFIDHVNEPGTYTKPIETMANYLDGLDAATTPLAVNDRVIAALGPKMLELARTRTAGTHPYLVTPELTAKAREGIGADGLVASEQGVVLETDPTKAREIARMHLATYLGLPNYSNNWKRQGFTDDDIANGGSDRLVDALVVWGDEAAIAARVQQHRDAGADHVCIQVLTNDPRALPVDEWRALAPALV